MCSPQRSESGYRLYSDRDVAIIRWLKSQVDAGMAISQAVAWLASLYTENTPLEQKWLPASGPQGNQARDTAPGRDEVRNVGALSANLTQALIHFDEIGADRGRAGDGRLGRPAKGRRGPAPDHREPRELRERHHELIRDPLGHVSAPPINASAGGARENEHRATGALCAGGEGGGNAMTTAFANISLAPPASPRPSSDFGTVAAVASRRGGTVPLGKGWSMCRRVVCTAITTRFPRGR